MSEPVLPLRDIVVFPQMIVPLFVGRKKSVNALEISMSENKDIILVTQRNSKIEDPKSKDLYVVGTLCKILQLLKLPDGTLKVLVEGKKRVRIEKFTQNKDFFEAEAVILSDTINKTEEIEALRRSVIDEFDRYAKLNRHI